MARLALSGGRIQDIPLLSRTFTQHHGGHQRVGRKQSTGIAKDGVQVRVPTAVMTRIMKATAMKSRTEAVIALSRAIDDGGVAALRVLEAEATIVRAEQAMGRLYRAKEAVEKELKDSRDKNTELKMKVARMARGLAPGAYKQLMSTTPWSEWVHCACCSRRLAGADGSPDSAVAQGRSSQSTGTM